jgi:hypothetical protein
MRATKALRFTVIAAAIAAAPAFAKDSMLERADKVLEGATTPMTQAIATAESQVGGKALSARLAHQHGKDFYDVRVVKGDQLTEVRIAIDDAKVMSTRQIQPHHMATTKPASPQKAEQLASKG